MSIDISVIIWTVISFVIFMFLLNRFLFKPILVFMDNRQKRIDEGKAAGERAKTAVEENKERMRLALEKRRHDEAIRADEALQEAKRVASLAAADAEIADEARRSHERQRLDDEQRQLISALDDNSAMLVSALARKLLTKEH